MRNIFALASLCLAAVLGTAFQSSAQTTAVPMNNHPIAPTSFGFQCVIETTCGPNYWITTTAQPGTVRLWNSGTEWDLLEQSANTYNWIVLDTFLDQLAEHQPTATLYTLGHVPCFISSRPCESDVAGWGGEWSPSPPKDLTSDGSKTFNDFVTALTTHCTAAGHCVKDYIKHWELWNEPNLPIYWTGTVNQLYDMMKPAVAIIRANVPGAIISTPPVCGGKHEYAASWLALENANGRLSDYYGFHMYLSGWEPEIRMARIELMIAAKNAAGSAWEKTPWMDTETSFSATDYVCDSTPEICHSQLVRWDMLLFAYQGGSGGAYEIGWYDWQTIAAGGYDTYFYTMMKWLVGSTFTASCSNNGTVYSCPLTESDGTSALVVWNSNGNSSYTPADQYSDYRAFNDTYGGITEKITSGEKTTIGLMPIMFEAVK
jgi:hypothetical protein